MGRAPCCLKVGLHRGPWTTREDALLTKYIQTHGEGNWRSMPIKAGLLRCGKSCRLRWMNYLRPDIKRGNITPDEDDLIIKMHSLLGNRWSLIAGRLPGRTDNEIKNYWNTHLSKILISQGTDPNTHKKLTDPIAAKQPKKRRSNNKINNVVNKRISSKLLLPNIPPEPEKLIKVHNPKPIRINSLSSFSNISTNSSFDWTSNNTASGSNSSLDGEKGVFTNWSTTYNLMENNIGDGVMNCSDIECQLSQSNATLEILYDEYLHELLKTTEDDEQFQLDSFAESLLI